MIYGCRNRTATGCRENELDKLTAGQILLSSPAQMLTYLFALEKYWNGRFEFVRVRLTLVGNTEGQTRPSKQQVGRSFSTDQTLLIKACMNPREWSPELYVCVCLCTCDHHGDVHGHALNRKKFLFISLITLSFLPAVLWPSSLEATA